MMKTEKKNQKLWFVLSWIVAYVVVMSVAENLGAVCRCRRNKEQEKTMNKRIMILAISGLLMLSGCGAATTPASASAAAPTATVQPKETVAPAIDPAEPVDNAATGESMPSAALSGKEAAEKELVTLLDAMEQDVTIGVPGSHMNTVRIAASLMNWGVGTELTNDEVRQIMLDWLMNKGNDEGVAINEKFAAVDEVYQSLLGDGGAEILAQANVENAAYPWSDEPLETVEAIMNAVGLR